MSYDAQQRSHGPVFVEVGAAELHLPLFIQGRGLSHPQGCRGFVCEHQRVGVSSLLDYGARFPRILGILENDCPVLNTWKMRTKGQMSWKAIASLCDQSNFHFCSVQICNPVLPITLSLDFSDFSDPVKDKTSDCERR